MAFWKWWGRLALVGGGAVSAACGQAPSPRAVVVDRSIDVTIHADGRRGPAPAAIREDDPRLPLARAQIAELLGHPLGFDVDEAVAAQFGSALHEAYVAGLESVGRALVDCKKHQPLAFEHGAPRLERVHLAYDPLGGGRRARPARSAAPLVGSTLRLAVHPGSRRLLDADELCLAFRGEQARESAARFAAHDAASLPAGDHAAYLRFVTTDHERPADPRQRDLDGLRQIVLAAELEPHLVDPELRDDVDEWLSRAGGRLRRELRQPTNDASRLTARGRARAAWIGWVNRRASQLAPALRVRVAQVLFTRESRDVPELREGFDAEAFALPILQRWLEDAAGDDPREPEDELYSVVVCKAERERQGRPTLFVRGHCTGTLYAAMAETPLGRKRLANLLIRSGHALLTQTAVLHVLRGAGAEPLVSLLEALAGDPPTLRVALRALGDYRHWGPKGDDPSPQGPVVVHPGPLVASVPRFWQSAPEQRPALLHLLVGVAAQRPGSVSWGRLAEFLGSRVDAPTLAAYLADDPRALGGVDRFLPALSAGWPRSQVLVPALDAALDADASGPSSDSRSWYLTNDVVELFCESGTRADLESLQKMLRARLERSPSQRRQLGSFVERSPERLCPRLASSTPRSAKKPAKKSAKSTVLFGD